MCSPASGGDRTSNVELLAWAATRQRPPETSLDESQRHETLGKLRQRRIDSLAFLASDETNVAQRVYDKLRAVQRRHAVDVVTELMDRGVRCITYKGLELEGLCFDSRALSYMNDVDLLVERRDLGEAKRVLFGQGYIQGHFDVATGELVEFDVPDLGAYENAEYELGRFGKVCRLALAPEELRWATENRRFPIAIDREGCSMVAEFDIHYSPAHGAEPEPLWRRAVPSTLGVGETFCAADHLWLTLTRYYFEVAQSKHLSLRELAYVAPLVAGADVAWDAVLGVVHEQPQLRCGLYYTLSFLSSLAGHAVPGEVLRELAPRTDDRERDWGWQLGRQLEFIEPFPLATTCSERTLR